MKYARMRPWVITRCF